MTTDKPTIDVAARFVITLLVIVGIPIAYVAVEVCRKQLPQLTED